MSEREKTCEELTPGCIGFTNGCHCAACMGKPAAPPADEPRFELVMQYPTIARLANPANTTVGYQGPELIREAVHCLNDLRHTVTEMERAHAGWDECAAQVERLERDNAEWAFACNAERQLTERVNDELEQSEAKVAQLQSIVTAADAMRKYFAPDDSYTRGIADAYDAARAARAEGREGK